MRAVDAYPVRAEKTAKPQRRAAAFVLLSGDTVLLTRRPPRGLLGGMNAFPTTPLTQDIDARAAPQEALLHVPAPANWSALEGAVRHVFTHFALELTVYVGAAKPRSRAPENCRWASAANIGKEGLPTLMQKVAIHAKIIDGRVVEK